jgi:5-methylcytosine-specific restriction endonuclease McrA
MPWSTMTNYLKYMKEPQHGTMSGYNWHTRKQKELPCEACRESMKDHWKNQRSLRNKEINVLRRAWRKEQRLRHNRSSGRQRARSLGVSYDYYTDQDVIDIHGTDCHICNKPIDFNAPRQCGKQGWEWGLQIDHIFPMSKGGSDTLDNVKPAHGYCNNIKNATIDYHHKFSGNQEEAS